MYRQTDRQSGWISDIVAAHPLVHVEYNRAPLRCGWAAVDTDMYTCMCIRAYLFPFLSVKTLSYLCFTNVYERICFCLPTFMSMHDSCQHTRAHTCRDHSHTLELRWWRVWRWFAIAPRTSIHTNMYTIGVCEYIHLFFVCLLFWVYTTASLPNCLFLLDTGNLFYWTTSCLHCPPTFSPGFHRLSECVCFPWLFGEYFTLQASGHTDLHARTDRHSGWIIEIVAAHPLVHVVHSRTPLRSGWATELQWTQACTRVCACVLISFLSFGENIVVFMLH